MLSDDHLSRSTPNRNRVISVGMTQYRNAAKLLLALTGNELNALLANGTVEEIKINEQKVPLKSTGSPS